MKIDRLVSIIMILLDKKRIRAHELADLFEVSLRTIYRDLDIINMAGIPVHSTPGVGGGFEIMPEYKLDKKTFSTGDLSNILMGLSGLSDMIRGDELVTTLAKVKSFIPAEQAKEIEVKASHVLIDLSPWTGNRRIQGYLDVIKTALQQSKLIGFEYRDRFGNKTARIAEPYQLVLKSYHWYFHGYCQNRNDFRLFKLSRISSLQILEEHFILREHQKPQLDFIDTWETMQRLIKIRIHKSVMERVLDYCSHEHLLPDGADHYIATFPFLENDYYYNILLSFGDKCECLDPPHIRLEMKRRIRELAAIYEN